MRTALLDSVIDVQGPPELLDALRAVLPPGVGTATAQVCVRRDAAGWSVAGPAGSTDVRDLHGAVEQVLVAVNRCVLDQCADLSLHAGVVAHGDRALAFPGVSGAGKSTLVAACLRAGWSYGSDEALVLRADGGVRAYPKPLTLLEWSLSRLALSPPPAGRTERAVPVHELGEVTAEPLVLAAVVQPVRRPGPPALEEVARGQTAVLLLQNAFNHYRDPAAAVSTVGQALRGASAWRLGYDDPLDGAALLGERLG